MTLIRLAAGKLQLNPATTRTSLAILALALGGFAIGGSEFLGMGMLPEMARDLLPRDFAISPDLANANASWVVTAYAAGVVVGAPVLAISTVRLPRKGLLLFFLAVFALASAMTAASPNFGFVILSRVIAGFPHGVFLGFAALTAAELLGPKRRALGAAFVIGGLTFSNVLGVPLMTWVGQNAGWRVTYLIVAALFVLTLVAVASAIRPVQAVANVTIRDELRCLSHRQLWLTLSIGAVGFGSLFALYAYIKPLAIQVTGVPQASVPLVLTAVGIGMTIGNFLGGQVADQSLRTAVFRAFATMLAGSVVLMVAASTVPGMVSGAVLVCIGAQALGPTLQLRLMDVGREGPTLAAALNHSAFNVANALGASLGGLVVGLGLGYRAPVWIGAVLGLAGLAIALLSFAADRHGEEPEAGGLMSRLIPLKTSEPLPSALRLPRRNR